MALNNGVKQSAEAIQQETLACIAYLKEKGREGSTDPFLASVAQFVTRAGFMTPAQRSAILGRMDGEAVIKEAALGLGDLFPTVEVEA